MDSNAKYELINTENDCRVRIVRLEDEAVRKNDSDDTLSKFLAMMDRKTKLPDVEGNIGDDDKLDTLNLSDKEASGNSSRRRKYGTCQTCGTRMLQRSLKRHVDEKHGDQPAEYSCDQCSYQTSLEHEVSKHRKIHKDDPVDGSKAAPDVDILVKNALVELGKNITDEQSPTGNVHVNISRPTEDVQSETPLAVDDDVNQRFSDGEASGLSSTSDNFQSVSEVCSTDLLEEASKETSEVNLEEPEEVVDEAAGSLQGADKEADNMNKMERTNHTLSNSLDCLAPPQGYEWFTSTDVSSLTGKDLSQFVLEHRKELTRQEHFYETLGEYRKRAMAVQKEAEESLIDGGDVLESRVLRQTLNDLRRKHQATLSDMDALTEDRRKILKDYQAYKRSTQAQISGLTLQIQGIQQQRVIQEMDTDGVLEI